LVVSKESRREKGVWDELSENDDVRGTEPVSKTIIIPNVNNVSPREREKYSSRTVIHVRAWMEIGCVDGEPVGSRTSGERRVIIMVGDMTRGAAWRVNHPAVPYVYA
jgi:hypothetical protein